MLSNSIVLPAQFAVRRPRNLCADARRVHSVRRTGRAALLLAPLVLLSILPPASAQSLPAATGHGFLQGGLGWSYARPDYSRTSIQGVSGFADFDLTPRFGVEAAIHCVSVDTPSDIGENTYQAGFRYVYRRGRLAPYAKLMAGIGSLVIQETTDNPGKYSGRYVIYTLGGGLDLAVSRHLLLRAADFEYQRWPGLGNGLTPLVVTSGVAYRFR